MADLDLLGVEAMAAGAMVVVVHRPILAVEGVEILDLVAGTIVVDVVEGKK